MASPPYKTMKNVHKTKSPSPQIFYWVQGRKGTKIVQERDPIEKMKNGDLTYEFKI